MSRVDRELAAEICTVKTATIRKWVQRGQLHRYWNGYDYDELIALRNRRDLDALCSRAGIRPEDRPGVSLATQ